MKAKVSAVMRWVGPLAIVGAVFAVISDQLGLVVHLPEVGDDAMGYHAVGSGLFLFVLTLLLIGMLGLYAGQNPDGPKVIEYGDARARYVLVEDPEEEPLAAERAPRARPEQAPVAVRAAAARRHRAAPRRAGGAGDGSAENRRRGVLVRGRGQERPVRPLV